MFFVTIKCYLKNVSYVAKNIYISSSQKVSLEDRYGVR